jgi:phenylalanyl-tRNA synthetase alpha chain
MLKFGSQRSGQPAKTAQHFLGFSPLLLFHCTPSAMQDALQALLEKAGGELPAIANRPEFEAAKARYVGPNGELTALMKRIGTASKEERPALGKLINEAKGRLQTLIDAALVRIEQSEIAAQLGPAVDPTLPTPDAGPGSSHPLTLVREELCRIFRKAGFAVVEGPEVETEWYCFDALNTPADHPARDLQDTFYLPEGTDVSNVSRRDRERYLLRTHTSSVQIRTMLRQQPPVRIISPGRVFRRDTVDATHSANFHQLEGLYVDRNVTVRDLKAVLDYLFQSLLGKDARTRFRPHYFGYTEPSFEVDLSAKHLGKVGKEWIEIMGCGIVDPAVFESVGYDPKQWTGYAFGLGIERIAMMLYGVDDIRHFYQNDARFLRQFA